MEDMLITVLVRAAVKGPQGIKLLPGQVVALQDSPYVRILVKSGNVELIDPPSLDDDYLVAAGLKQAPEVPKVEVPKVETPTPEAPKVEVPKVKTPAPVKTETKEIEEFLTRVKRPEAKVPEVKAPIVKTEEK